MIQNSTKSAQVGPSWSQIDARWHQNLSKMTASWPQFAPSWPKLTPRRFKGAQSWHKLAPSRFKLSPSWPKLAEVATKVGQVGPKWAQVGSVCGPFWHLKMVLKSLWCRLVCLNMHFQKTIIFPMNFNGFIKIFHQFGIILGQLWRRIGFILNL